MRHRAAGAAAGVSAASQVLQERLQERAQHHTYREGPVCRGLQGLRVGRQIPGGLHLPFPQRPLPACRDVGTRNHLQHVGGQAQKCRLPGLACCAEADHAECVNSEAQGACPLQSKAVLVWHEQRHPAAVCTGPQGQSSTSSQPALAPCLSCLARSRPPWGHSHTSWYRVRTLLNTVPE